MTRDKKRPLFMRIYKCNSCSQESGFTELDEPICRYCDAKDSLVLISEQELTAEVMAIRLKEVADKMMNNMKSAFDAMDDSAKDAFGEGKDTEEEMLKLLARIQRFRDQIHNLELKDPKDEGESS
jgi:hypothetical protein